MSSLRSGMSSSLSGGAIRLCCSIDLQHMLKTAEKFLSSLTSGHMGIERRKDDLVAVRM